MTDGTPASHMALRDRKAFSLLGAYFRTVAEVSENDAPSNKAQSEFEDLIRKLAKAVLFDTANAPLEDFLANAVTRADQAARVLLDTNFASVEPTATALRAKIARIRCRDCRNGTICDGGSEDDQIVEAGGECISEIKAAFRGALDEADREYGRLPKMTVSLHTTGRNSPPGSVPGIGLAINGRTSYADEHPRRSSFVTLEVASAHMDALSLAALPYVMLHEVLCHAYQMSDGSGDRTSPVAYVDPLSEGMLDAVAVHLLETRAEKERDSRPEATEEAEIAQRIHLARKSTRNRPLFPQAPQVNLGATIFETIRTLYSRDSDLESAIRDAKRLAYDLNLHGWSIENRFKGFSRLRRGLEAKPRDPELLRLILEYRNTSVTAQEIVSHVTSY